MAPTAPHRPDPAGVFDTDTHRRALAYLPLPDGDPIPTEEAAVPLAQDENTPVAYVDEAAEILKALEAEGYAERSEEGRWKMTQEGFDALTGPIPNEPPPMEGARLEEAEAKNAQEAEEARELELKGSKKLVKDLEKALAEAKKESASKEKAA